MRIPRRAAIWTAVLLILAALSAAVWIGSRSATAPPPTEPPERMTIAISQSSIRFALVLIAAGTGYFKEAGLDVSFQPHSSGRDALAAALDGKADLATVAETPLVLSTMRGQALSIIATVSYSGIEGIVARKDHGITTIADLKGKRIAATIGSTAHYVLDTILLYHYVPLDQVTLVNTTPDKMKEALVKGEVDAISVWEPFLSRIRAAVGESGVLFQAQDLYRSTFNLAGRREYVFGHPETMRKLMRALVRAEQFVKEKPTEARAMVSRMTQLPREVIDRDWPQYTLRVALDQELLTLLDSQARWVIRNRLAASDTAPNFMETVSWDALESVSPRAVTIIR